MMSQSIEKWSRDWVDADPRASAVQPISNTVRKPIPVGTQVVAVFSWEDARVGTTLAGPDYDFRTVLPGYDVEIDGRVYRVHYQRVLTVERFTQQYYFVHEGTLLGTVADSTAEEMEKYRQRLSHQYPGIQVVKGEDLPLAEVLRSRTYAHVERIP